jgi:hypothetical protein
VCTGLIGGLCVVQDGRVPEQKIKLRHGDTLLIDTMEGNTMMNWLKRFLAGGFQVRLSNSFAAACRCPARALLTALRVLRCSSAALRCLSAWIGFRMTRHPPTCCMAVIGCGLF